MFSVLVNKVGLVAISKFVSNLFYSFLKHSTGLILIGKAITIAMAHI